MKKLILMLSLVCSVSSYSEEVATFFQWGDEACGLLFDDTNLTVKVRAVISDDVGLIFSRIPTNTSTYAITNDVRYTGGLKDVDGSLYYPRGFRFGTYKTLGTTNYYYIRETVSSNYIAGISLTSHYPLAVQSLKKFLERAEQIRPGNITTNEYCQLSWDMENNCPFTESTSPHIGNIGQNIANVANTKYLYPSLLAFGEYNIQDNNYLCCHVYLVARSDTTQRAPKFLVYIDDKWYFSHPMK